MKATIEKINIENITRDDADEILNEIATLCKENNTFLVYRKDEFPRLWELYCLLKGCFINSHTGVHVIDDEK